MGQYYRPVITDNGNQTIIDPHCADNGAKLMEHSYIDNSLVLAVADLIYKKPKAIVWCGDYATDDELKPFGITTKIWEKDIKETYSPALETMVGKWLINHTQGIQLKLDKDGDELCICPLPLFTAVGNGRGGGDYRGDCMDDVGMWAGDVISIEDVANPQYETTVNPFKE